MKICKVKNCHRDHYGRGWCSFHYQRWKRWGSPLIVKPRGWSKGKPCPEETKKKISLSSLGKNKGLNRGSKNVNWRGGVAEYPNHYLMKQNRLIILLNNPKCEVCEEPATEIHHRNGNKSDHRLENLMPCCRKCNRGALLHPNSSKYRRLYGGTLKELGEKFNLPPCTILDRIRRGVPPDSLFCKGRVSKYRRKYGMTLREMAIKADCSTTTMYKKLSGSKPYFHPKGSGIFIYGHGDRKKTR